MPNPLTGLTQIKSTDITDGTIVDADISPSPSISGTKVDVDLGLAEAQTPFNIGLLGFKKAVNEGLTIFNLMDGIVDEFHSEGGIDTAENSNAVYDATSDFYVYEVQWSDDELNFYVDGQYLGTYFKTNSGWQQWPYDQDFYIILNLAIGSHFMPCNTENNFFPQKLEVDYVRVYQLGAGCGLEGDINQDKSINVSDVVILVSHVLCQNIDFNDCNDLNNDNQINITDIVYLINLILSPTGRL